MSFLGCKSILLHGLTNLEIQAIFFNLGLTKAMWRMWPFCTLGKKTKYFFSLARKQNIFYPCQGDKIFCTLAWTSLQCRPCLCPHKGDTESKALAWSLNWNPIHASSPSPKCSEYSSVYVHCMVLIMFLNSLLYNTLLAKRVLQHFQC